MVCQFHICRFSVMSCSASADHVPVRTVLPFGEQRSVQIIVPLHDPVSVLVMVHLADGIAAGVDNRLAVRSEIADPDLVAVRVIGRFKSGKAANMQNRLPVRPDEADPDLVAAPVISGVPSGIAVPEQRIHFVFVDQQMRRDSFVHNAKGFNYEYFLRDLLDEKITAGMRGSVNMKFTGNAFSGNLYCMVIETARSAEVLNIHLIRNMIESRFPYSRSIIYNGQIVTILSLDQSLVFPDEYVQAGRDFCKENQLFAGLSNCFSDIMDLHAYYSQALRAIEYGTENIGWKAEVALPGVRRDVRERHRQRGKAARGVPSVAALRHHAV